MRNPEKLINCIYSCLGLKAKIIGNIIKVEGLAPMSYYEAFYWLYNKLPPLGKNSLQEIGVTLKD